MNNLSFSKKFSSQYDNGERNMCWRAGIPVKNGVYIFTTKWNEIVIYQYKDGRLCDEYNTGYLVEDIIAYMKLPAPFKTKIT